jgi:hypothetical protein
VFLRSGQHIDDLLCNVAGASCNYDLDHLGGSSIFIAGNEMWSQSNEENWNVWKWMKMKMYWGLSFTLISSCAEDSAETLFDHIRPKARGKQRKERIGHAQDSPLLNLSISRCRLFHLDNLRRSLLTPSNKLPSYWPSSQKSDRDTPPLASSASLEQV